MTEKINSGITFFAGSKVTKSAFKIKENYGSQHYKLVAKDGDQNKSRRQDDRSNKCPENFSPGSRTINTGIAVYDSLTFDGGAIEIEKNIGHQKIDVQPSFVTSSGRILLIHELKYLYFEIPDLVYKL